MIVVLIHTILYCTSDFIIMDSVQLSNEYLFPDYEPIFDIVKSVNDFSNEEFHSSVDKISTEDVIIDLVHIADEIIIIISKYYSWIELAHMKQYFLFMEEFKTKFFQFDPIMDLNEFVIDIMKSHPQVNEHRTEKSELTLSIVYDENTLPISIVNKRISTSDASLLSSFFNSISSYIEVLLNLQLKFIMIEQTLIIFLLKNQRLYLNLFEKIHIFDMSEILHITNSFVESIDNMIIAENISSSKVPVNILSDHVNSFISNFDMFREIL